MSCLSYNFAVDDEILVNEFRGTIESKLKFKKHINTRMKIKLIKSTVNKM